MDIFMNMDVNCVSKNAPPLLNFEYSVARRKMNRFLKTFFGVQNQTRPPLAN